MMAGWIFNYHLYYIFPFSEVVHIQQYKQQSSLQTAANTQGGPEDRDSKQLPN